MEDGGAEKRERKQGLGMWNKGQGESEKRSVGGVVGFKGGEQSMSRGQRTVEWRKMKYLITFNQ